MEPGEHLEHGGLAASGRADEGDQLAGHHVESDVRDGENFVATAAVDLAHPGTVDERLAHAPRPLVEPRVTDHREPLQEKDEGVQHHPDGGDEQHRHEHRRGVERDLDLQHEVAEALL